MINKQEQATHIKNVYELLDGYNPRLFSVKQRKYLTKLLSNAEIDLICAMLLCENSFSFERRFGTRGL
jgi:hypothetical protein